MANKVKFNLKNVHYAVYDQDAGTWSTPVHIPGAVSISMDPEGEPSNFYADGYAYYVTNNNSGYSGDLEMALWPDEFRKDCLGEVTDPNTGFLIETTASELSHFALMFEFDGDKNSVRHIFYNCTASRPSVASQTNEDTVEVQTETSTITAGPLANGIVKGKADPTCSGYDKFYESVTSPSVTV